MEGFWTRRQDGDGSSPGQVGEFILPSRRAALEACLRGLTIGPVLITGDAGVGKTWLAERLANQSVEHQLWVTNDVSPSLDAAGLLRSIGRRLGLEAATVDALNLADTLAEESANGRRWGLILDEVHLASDALLEEIRILSNRLGRRDGFAAVVLVGQSPLIRRLATRSQTALASRLAARVHLRAIDADEAGVLIDHLAPGCARDSASLDRCHRDAAGNPRRLLALASLEAAPKHRAIAADRDDAAPATREPFWIDSRPRAEAPPTPSEPRSPSGSEASEPRIRAEEPEDTLPPFEPFLVRAPFGSERPPIASDDGMIEVGWDPDADDEAEHANGEAVEDAPDADEAPRTHQSTPAQPETERLADHYAALQAWEEWSRNQGRSDDGRSTLTGQGTETSQPPAMPFESTRSIDQPGPTDVGSDQGSVGYLRANLWAEGQHGHSPYGPLFNGARQPRDSEG